MDVARCVTFVPPFGSVSKMELTAVVYIARKRIQVSLHAEHGNRGNKRKETSKPIHMPAELQPQVVNDSVYDPPHSVTPPASRFVIRRSHVDPKPIPIPSELSPTPS
jgi:hypothetical protein